MFLPCLRSVASQTDFFRFARTLNEFTNRLNDYILCENETGTREQVTTKYSNRHQPVLPQCQIGADT